MQIQYIDQLTAPDDWALRSCGAACALMILKSLTSYDGDLADLIQELQKDNGFLTGVGWRHAALARILEEYGLKANVEKHLDLERMLNLLAQDNLVILSIKSRISDGSHMVLVTNKHEGIVTVHDPYNLDCKGGVYECSLDDLVLVSNQKGISLRNPENGLLQMIGDLVKYQPEEFELYDHRQES